MAFQLAENVMRSKLEDHKMELLPLRIV